MKNSFYLALILAILSSCSPEYIPNMVNSPMFSNAGEFQATVATGTSNFDAQVAYAITDHIGIMANGSYGNEKNDTTDYFQKHTFLEGGFGYYNKFGQNGRYEVYGGYGYGKVNGFFETLFADDALTEAHYNRFFIQPGISLSTGIYDGGFSPRFVFLQMNPKGSEFLTGKYNVLFEPVFTSKIGFKYVKFIFQIGASLPINDNNTNFDHDPFIMNLGININIGRKYDF